MATAAKDVIHQAVDLLQDVTSIRWPAPELVRWLNSGQREVIVYRPDALNLAATVTCVAGTKQALPANAVQALAFPRNNSASSKRAITMVPRSILDTQIPTWHSLAGSAEILHVMYDPKEPLAFWTYPPATVAAQVDVLYVSKPTDVVEPAAGSDWNAVAGNISVADKYANALVDYILYRAYGKDAPTRDPARSANAYTAFANALGVDVKTLLAVMPKPEPRNDGEAQVPVGGAA